MRYREIKPSTSLARFIECFWTLEREATTTPAVPERILPDGCVELILNFGSPFREVGDDGSEEIQPNFFLVGQMTRPMLISSSGHVELIGIRFHPGGTLPCFKLPMNQLTNQTLELSNLSHAFQNGLVNQLGDLPTLSQRLKRLAALLESQLSTQDSSPIRLLVAEIVARRGQFTVDEISTAAGISSRQLERRFLAEVGLAPKMFGRILRFQQVFRALDRYDAGWAAIASDCGYYDQAHLIRDFQQFAGRAPAMLLAQASPLMHSFTRKGRMSHFSNTQEQNCISL